MDDLVKDVIPLLQYLIPGFVSTWIFYTLTAFKQPDTFGQIVQALIFTFVIHGAVTGIGVVCLWVGAKGLSVGIWDGKAQTSWAFFSSLILGLLSCCLATNDRLHGWLRRRNVTKQSSYPSEWFCAFAQFDRLITLHLHDERRVAGCPAEWPPESANGQFLIHNPRWLDASGQTTPFGAEFLLIDSAKVKWVEFSPASEGSS
ncbi:hypothetical protein ATI02_1486 [Pseudomonas baetica]|uniref:Prophage PssSM-03 n=1 Tax=Pseudomonas baetica TaxID=674054 RepID=A0ABX4PY08_9PSED|nr:DUF6338 family protein [Pseudomonas baetica]PKA68698.1 hypothetical protein ATI02_1486 [Pseudomonas baetica]PTC19251.1 hypothetical protein C0J26_12600 [Pseudomonas baetica]